VQGRAIITRFHDFVKFGPVNVRAGHDGFSLNRGALTAPVPLKRGGDRLFAAITLCEQILSRDFRSSTVCKLQIDSVPK
jgi:hypothetical protein